MAYGAVGSLELTIERLLNSSHIPIVQTSSPQIISLLYEEILSLREALREFDECRIIVDMKMVKTLEAEIIDVVYKFEDVIDLHISNQFHSLQSDEETDHPPLMVHSLDVQEIKQDIDSFIEMVDKMKIAYIHELCNPTPHDEEDGFFISTRIDFGGNESNMVGNCCCLPAIEVLRIADCYKLKEIPLTFGTSLVEILVLDCNPMAVSCGIKLQKEWYDKYGDGKRSLVLRGMMRTSNRDLPY